MLGKRVKDGVERGIEKREREGESGSKEGKVGDGQQKR